MALQTKDLLSSTFGGSLDTLQELNLSHKGLEDVKAVSSAANLLVVNLSLSFIQNLDISKNRVVSLKPLASLSGTLLSSRFNLELWLQNNQVADHTQLQSLSSLPLLSTLFLAQNPLSAALKQNYRPAVVAALINLQILDGQPVSSTDRSSATDYANQQAEAAKSTLEASSSLSGSHGLPGSLPSSSQPGNKLNKGKNLSLRSKGSGVLKSSAQQAVPRDDVQATAVTIQSAPEPLVGFEGVEQQLPKFDIDKHGNRLDQPFDPYGTSRFKNTLKPVPAGPAECVYQTCYGHTGQHQAVIVWSDGSATAQYASEGVAVSVDPDRTGASAGMRLLATYRSTGLPAVMFEVDGTGSVQYPNGNLWMTYTAESSKGALYSHSGEGFSYFDRQPVVYFACEGHNQRFVQGLNAAQPCWDEPPVHGVPKFLQQLLEENKASSFVMPPADLSMTFGSTSSKAGVGTEQLKAVSAALQALQSSMMTMMSAPSTSTADSTSQSMTLPDSGAG